MRNVSRLGFIAVGLVVMTMATSSAAQASTYVPSIANMNVTYNASFNGCNFSFQHGNVYATSYAKLRANNSNCSFFYSETIGTLNGQCCSLKGAFAGDNHPIVKGTWYQATLGPYSNGVAAKYVVVSKSSNQCLHVQYNRLTNALTSEFVTSDC